jgi:hypothetical protein
MAVQQQRMEALIRPNIAEAARLLAQCAQNGIPAATLARNFDLSSAGMSKLLVDAKLVQTGSGESALVLTREQSEGMAARKPSPVTLENPAHLALWQQSEPELKRAGFGGLTVAQLAERIGGKEVVVRDMLYGRSRSGDTVRVGDNRFYLSATIEEFADLARRVALEQAGQRFTAAVFRDHAGIGRTLAIEVLEALDRLGITQRLADVRVIREQARNPVEHGVKTK